MVDPPIVSSFPDFEEPPVIEVVCGILFKPITSFITPHIGLLWGKYRPEYPNCREVAPLNPVLERPDDVGQVSIEIATAPPLPRTWFIEKKGNSIIQIQRDRFLHNWRKMSSNDEYPRYQNVKQRFFSGLTDFEDFLTENSLGVIEPLQYEMTYINHIPQDIAWSDSGSIGKIFPDFAFRAQSSRFLPAPSGMNWQTSFLLPQNVGRLHVKVRNAKLRDTGKPLLIFELTVRGIGEDKSRDAMKSWFNTARKWIVCGFADLTGEEIQRVVWKRRS